VPAANAIPSNVQVRAKDTGVGSQQSHAAAIGEREREREKEI
jgi:hypothetical protein